MHIGWRTPQIGFATFARTPPPAFENAHLMNDFEATGNFWQPQRSADRYCGRLKYTPGRGGITLLLDGNLTSDSGIPYRGIKVPILNGLLFDGTPCTLLNGWCNVETFITDDRHFRSEITVRNAVLGASFSSDETCLLAKVAVRYSHLDDWFENPYEIKYKRSGFAKSLVCFSPDEFGTDATFEGTRLRIESFCQRTIPIVVTPNDQGWTYHYTIALTPAKPQRLSSGQAHLRIEGVFL